jgi:hypothetical protein
VLIAYITRGLLSSKTFTYASTATNNSMKRHTCRQVQTCSLQLLRLSLLKSSTRQNRLLYNMQNLQPGIRK